MNLERRTARDRVRFWRNVQKGDGCWLWTAGKNKDGYGSFYCEGKARRAHRVAFEWESGGPLAPDVIVRHVCDTPACVRPSHLLAGTQQDNIDDAYARGRKCDAGSANRNAKLTEAQVLAIRALYSGGVLTQDQLAEQFGIHQGHVTYIVNRKCWTHI